MSEKARKRQRPIIKSVAFTESEWRDVARRMKIAEAHSFGEFGRRCILDSEIKVRKIAFDPALIGTEFSRIGNNINQIARLVNSESITTLEEMKATRALVQQIQALIEQARKEAE